ncbi:MAG: right-handed parallel beta-helix repeat-containing protein [Kiritimatiellales bacterium]|nr:right-handed parallel beta-helix repeat-containing protein [Kiritimatiellales bacterium]
MKRNIAKAYSVSISILFGLCASAMADTHYVDINNPSPTVPYTSWATATTNIQDAVDQSSDDDNVLVTNGHYVLSSYISVTKDITIQSVNGPDNTIVDGNKYSRCFSLGRNTCAVSGFTITNGYISMGNGGGVYCSDMKAIVTNCVIRGNMTTDYGGGIYKGSIYDCTISDNTALRDGGGICKSDAHYCTISRNSASGHGGGMDYGAAKNCTFSGNSATNDGGGSYYGTATNCSFSNNSSKERGGGMYLGTAYNCTFNNNSAEDGGGLYRGTAINCIIIKNKAENDGGGVCYAAAKNSIVWYNVAANSGDNITGLFAEYTCSPDVTHGIDGNITNVPLLVSASHIATNSPCRKAGNILFCNDADIDGELWLNPPSMGCDEFHGQGTVTGPIQLSMQGTTNICSNYAGTYLINIQGALIQNVVNFDDGYNETNAVLSSTHIWEAPGFYNVVLTAANDDYPDGLSVTQEVHVYSSEESTVYVSDSTGNDTLDGRSWVTAKKSIQSGVDEQNIHGGVVLVSNGTYSSSSEILVDKTVRLLSVNGPQTTIIDGGGSNRCFQLGMNDCLLGGLTIANGFAELTNPGDRGGGIFCWNTTSIITNCVFSGNSAIWGGGMSGGTANNCTFVGNSAKRHGGGMLISIADNCSFISNSATYGGGIFNVVANTCSFNGNLAEEYGGGMCNSTADRCIFSSNSAIRGGGMYQGTSINCTFSSNLAEYGGGMYRGEATNCSFNGNLAEEGGGGVSEGTVHNCLVSSNLAYIGGGISEGSAHNCIINENSATYGGGMYNGTVHNSVIIGNSAMNRGGGLYGGTANNSIIWYNTASTSGEDFYSTTTKYCCSPDLTHGVDGNIVNAPMFVNEDTGNFSLQAGSPCIDAGSNVYVFTTTDLAGIPRIINDIVDMGAYESFVFANDFDGDGLLNDWELLYFGDVIIASASADPDGDGHNNADEQITGMNPTNIASCFKVNEYEHSDLDGFIVNWESVSGRVYQVHWGTNLMSGFQSLETNIFYPRNSYTDSVHHVEDDGFYKVDVRLQ